MMGKYDLWFGIFVGVLVGIIIGLPFGVGMARKEILKKGYLEYNKTIYTFTEYDRLEVPAEKKQ